MSPCIHLSRTLLAAVSVAALVIAGCGGAESRKARHLAKGEAYLAEGNYEKARVEFRNALQIAPNDSTARYENGVAAEKLGNALEAVKFYQGAIDVDTDNVAARAALARLFVFGGAPERALETVTPALVKHPDDARLLTVRAAAKIQLKDPDAALADAERAYQLAPQDPDTIAVLAGIYKSRGDQGKARTILEAGIKAVPNTVDLRLVLAELDIGEGKIDQAEALLIELVKMKPAEKSHRLRLAQFYVHTDHVDEAERVLRAAVTALPDDHDLKIELVKFLLARRGNEAAEKELAAMIAADPKDYELKFAEAQLYVEQKQVAKAEDVYKSVIATGTEAAAITARDRWAALLIQNNNVPGAEKLLADVLAKSPRDNDALIMRGNLALAHKDPKGAISDLRAVLRDQPNAPGVMRSLARAHLLNGEPALAEETMRRAVDANPKDAGARLDLALLLVQLGKAEQAKPVINELVKQYPNDLNALDAQFRIAVATRDLAAAGAAADAIVALQPKEALGYYYRGEVAEASKKPEDALRDYQQAIEVNPQAQDPWAALTRALVQMNRAPEAIKRLDEAAAKYPKVAFPYNLKGEVLIATHHPAEAKQAFSAAIERDPKWPAPYAKLAEAQAADKDLAGAVATLEKAITVVSQPDLVRPELADLYERMGKPDDAIRVYEEGVKKNPQSDFMANNLAMLLVNYKTDRASLDRAKELSARFANSPNADYLDTYGWVLYKHGDSAAAVAALKAALAMTPNSPVALYHLGMAQVSTGQDDAARDNLSRSLKAGKTFAGMDEAKATLEKLAKNPAGNAPPKT